MIRNFLVDADETILDFVRSSRESFVKTLKSFGIEQAESFYGRFKEINDSLWREYEKGTITKSDLVVERFSRLFKQLKIDKDARCVNERYFATLCDTGYWLPGARTFLDRLRMRGKVFLITNGTPAAQYGRLKSVGLEHFFDGVFISDEIGYAKPDEQFFTYVLNRLQVSKCACIVIGDSLTSDMKGANNAGISSIWYNPQGKKAEGAEPDFVAQNYDQVLERIDDLQRKGS